MTQSVPSNATPEMLKWARVTRGLSIAEVAKLEKVTEESIQAWESGDETPSLARLRKLAKRYKRPLMVFYLEKPPMAFSVVKDFRLLPSGANRGFSPALRYAIRVAQERQAWARDALEDVSVRRHDFVGSIKPSGDIDNISRTIRQQLSVTLSEQVKCDSRRESLNLWRSRVEEYAGVFVFQSTGVAVEEMRGCALSDDIAPAILINAQDAYSARTFTLIHELVHVYLGETAITGAGEFSFSFSPNKRVERFCNQVAAEVLIPASDFKLRVPKNWQANDDNVIKSLSDLYNVSRAVIAIRLAETGFASQDYLANKWAALQTKPTARKSDGGPPPHILAISRSGESFTKLALASYYANEIHGGQLASLINFNLQYLPKLESVLYPQRVQLVS